MSRRNPSGRGRKAAGNKNGKKYQIRVFAEGQKTEEQYLVHWSRAHREHVILTVAPHVGSTPSTIVDAAISERQRDLRDQKRSRGNAYDEYWCVFDVDEHPNLEATLKR
ncbi:hypothetical protein GP2_070_00010, partial [Gordonia paraffinivorans NBRC 108238]